MRSPATGLNIERVHEIRTAGKSDHHWSRMWGMTVGAIRSARIGDTWADHPTAPDAKPRTSGRPTDLAVVDINRALSAWGRPSIDDSGATP